MPYKIDSLIIHYKSGVSHTFSQSLLTAGILWENSIVGNHGLHEHGYCMDFFYLSKLKFLFFTKSHFFCHLLAVLFSLLVNISNKISYLHLSL